MRARRPLRVAVCGETHTLAVEYYDDDGAGATTTATATAKGLSSAASAAARYAQTPQQQLRRVRTARVVVPCAWLDAQAAITGHGGASAADVADAVLGALPPAASRGAGRSQLRRLCIHVVAAHRARECCGRVFGGEGLKRQQEEQEQEEQQQGGSSGAASDDGGRDAPPHDAAAAADNNSLIEVDLADLGLDD